MESYWTCPDCGSANLYPAQKVCEVCGKPISAHEIAEMQKSVKDNISHEKQAKRREKLERSKKRIEKFKHSVNAKKQTIHKKIEKKSKSSRKKSGNTLKRFTAAEEKFLASFKKISKTVTALLIIAALASFAVVGVSVFRNDNVGTVRVMINDTLEKGLYDIIFVHTYHERDERYSSSRIGRKIDSQAHYLREQIAESENIKKLIESLGW